MDYKTQIIPIDILPSYMLQSDIVRRHMKELPTTPMTIPIGLIGIPYVPITMEAYNLDEFIIAYRFANWLMIGCPIEFILFVDICDMDLNTLQTNLPDTQIRRILEKYIKMRKQVELPVNDRTVCFVDDKEMVIIMPINGKKFKATIDMQQFPQYGKHAFYAEHVTVNYISYGTLLNSSSTNNIMRVCHMMLFVDDEFYEHSFVAKLVKK